MMKDENNKKQSIGIFDSGIGGLTVMKEIVELFPSENIVYLGDTARLPYGEKSPETIIRYSIENANFLLEHDIKVLVVACNTASAYAIEKLKQFFNIPVIGVIEPGAEKAVFSSKNGRIAVLGTKATINSGVYQKEILKLLPKGFVLPLACPLFVPLVEESFITHPITKMMIKEYLEPLKEQNIDTILLGCTHYPLLKEMIQEEVGNLVTIVDSAQILAEKLRPFIFPSEVEREQVADHRYFVSDDPEKFTRLGSKFFGRPLTQVELFFSR